MLPDQLPHLAATGQKISISRSDGVTKLSGHSNMPFMRNQLPHTAGTACVRCRFIAPVSLGNGLCNLLSPKGLAIAPGLAERLHVATIAIDDATFQHHEAQEWPNTESIR
ncbi:hypothetical protein [Nitratireductor basaltis]|uniref:hypothetical protein n=1 Tax=Nitratireductor basaltis TaxID=472175 RepID=UPI00190F413E|nr:hypothetical protein [Nitratireductor basaltis]